MIGLSSEPIAAPAMSPVGRVTGSILSTNRLSSKSTPKCHESAVEYRYLSSKREQTKTRKSLSLSERERERAVFLHAAAAAGFPRVRLEAATFS